VSKRFRLLGLVVLAIFALGAVASATASAETLPEMIPTPKAKDTFTSKVEGASHLEGSLGSEIVCSAAANTGEFTSAKKGEMTVTFTGCKDNKKVACNTQGAAKEKIILESGFQVVAVLLANVLLFGILLIVPALLLKIECGLVQVLLLGPVIGVAEKVVEGKKGSIITLTYKRELKENKPVKGEQGEKTCMAPEVPCLKEPGGEFLLKGEFGKGEELASVELTDIITFAKEYEFRF
jgi:hypothetical protein